MRKAKAEDARRAHAMTLRMADWARGVSRLYMRSGSAAAAVVMSAIADQLDQVARQAAPSESAGTPDPGDGFVRLYNQSPYRRRNNRGMRRLARAWLANRDGGSYCRYCGVDLEPHEQTVDHVVPISCGGLDRLSNLVLACRACNLKKGDKIGTPAPPRSKDAGEGPADA